MAIRPLLIMAAVFATLLPAQADPFGPRPSVVRPGPPQLPSDPDRWLPWRVFTWRDGVKPGAPALARDTQGYIWAATPDGIVRYNGQTWQKVELPGGDPFKVNAITPGRDGSLWLGRDDGSVLRLRGGEWSRVGKRSGLPEGMVTALLETAEGSRSSLWVATITGLSRCRDDVCAEMPALRGFNVRTMISIHGEDGRLALWIGTKSGLFRLDGAETNAPRLSPLFADSTALSGVTVRSLAETISADGRRSLWVGTDLGVARLRDGVWTRYGPDSGFPTAPVVKLLATTTPEGPVVWAAGFRSGLIRFRDDGRWQRFDTRSGLPANYPYNLLETGDRRTGTLALWVATPGALARLDYERWHAVDTTSGLPNELVMGVGEASFPDGLRTYWVGSLGGMVRLTPRGWERFSVTSSEAPEVVFSSVNAREEDGTESLWLGTMGGAYRFAHSRWQNFTSSNSPLPGDWVMELLALPSLRGQAVWAGTSQGLARIEGERWTVFRAGSGGLPGDDVRALEATSLADGRYVLWAGTNGGLGRFEADRWTAVSVPCLPHPWVFAIHPATAPDGTRWLWIGTQGGVARMRLDGQGRLQGPCEPLTNRTRPAALSHAAVAQIQSDAWGRIYVFTNWGVNRINLPRSGELAAARLEAFAAGDGLPGLEFNSTSFRDHLGRIWGGATGGAAVLDPAPPRRLPARRTGAPLILEHVKVAGREQPLANGAVLRHNEDSLEFQYALLSYGREHRTVYRTQLAGLEDKPTPWSREAGVVYNRLPQGSYTFRAWGRDSEGTVSGPIEVVFQIRPAPWLTSWAIAVYALTLMGLGYGANQMRVKALARRAALLETQVAERTRELAEANHKLELASLTDPLTGLSNRRFLDLNIGPDLQQAARSSRHFDRRDHNSDLIFYFIDLDHFKRLNDQAGHAGGDAVLVEVGRRLRAVARTTDAVVRWGGEEFLIVSRWTDRQAGSVLAVRILEAVALEPFAVAGRSASMTCSVGWAPFPWHLEEPGTVSFEEVLSLADRALYLAKREGRNRAVGALPGPHNPPGATVLMDALEDREGTAFELVRTPGPQVRSEEPVLASLS